MIPGLSSPPPAVEGTVSDIPDNAQPFGTIHDVTEDVTEDPGLVIDQEMHAVPSEILPERTKTAPKSGAPTLDEWQKFFSRIVIRFLTDGYLALAFRGIDEESVSDRDVAKLKLSPDERTRIAVPFAEFANKSKLARKHGRMVVASADSFESMATLAIWMGRVNRIARKYRTPSKTATRKVRDNVDSRSNQDNGRADAGQPGVTILNPNI